MALSGITSAESTSSQASATVTAVNLPAAASETASNNSRAAAGSATVFEAVDTVTLQNKSQKAGSESSTEKAEKALKAKNSKNSATRSVSDVLFDYNARGDLRIKFMDSGNNLIYQTPPVLFAKIADLMTETQSSVDTKV